MAQKNKYGQYFTPDSVAEFMVDMANITTDSKILEPSCGQGVFLDVLHKKGFKNIVAYEIDPALAQQFRCVRHESFVSADIDERYDLIIGNPPYIRWKNLEPDLRNELLQNLLWKKHCNSLCDYLHIFILKSIKLLNENGQLIFICPEYWMSTTHSKSLRDYMMQNGYFEEIYHFNETPIFSNSNISVIIFKFVKSKYSNKKSIQLVKYYAKQQLTRNTLRMLKARSLSEKTEYLSIPQFKINARWLLQSSEMQKELSYFESKCINFNETNNKTLGVSTIKDICDIGNGMVSGLDKAFQIKNMTLSANEEKATINVIKAKDLNQYWVQNTTRYIFIRDNLNELQFINSYPTFYAHLQKYKAQLENRYQYKKRIKYWEWVFLRNFSLFSKNERRIFVPCKERISNKNHFRFSMVDQNIFPTQDVTAILKKPNTRESLEYILAYLNNYRIFDWLKCNGIVKGNIIEFSEKPIASIPFRMINWSSDQDIILHNMITESTKKYLRTRDASILNIIHISFDKLFE